jgi:uncharacterized protein
MRYEWDERKNLANQRKHGGIGFGAAALVFDDPHCIFGLDHIDDGGEQRWHVVGAIPVEDGAMLILLVVHVYREDQDGEEIIRIISARRAGQHDVRRYKEQALD